MKLQIFTELVHLLQRLETLYPKILRVDTPRTLDAAGIVFTDPSAAASLLQLHPGALVMVLSDRPSFAEGMRLLPLGIRGYSNTYTHSEHLEQALATIRSGNVWLYPEFMQQLIASAGIPAAPEKPDLLAPLTLRERETALLVSQGRSNKEIAAQLGITERTVKQHLSNIYVKLDVGDRFALAMLLR